MLMKTVSVWPSTSRLSRLRVSSEFDLHCAPTKAYYCDNIYCQPILITFGTGILKVAKKLETNYGIGYVYYF